MSFKLSTYKKILMFLIIFIISLNVVTAAEDTSAADMEEIDDANIPYDSVAMTAGDELKSCDDTLQSDIDAEDLGDASGKAQYSEIIDVAIENDYVVSAKLVNDTRAGIADAVINYDIDGVSKSTVTGLDGSFKIAGKNKCVINIFYAGNSTYLASNTSVTLNFARLSTQIVGSTFTQYAIDYYAGERGGYFNVQLFDENLNVLANKPIIIGFNGKAYNSLTNEFGWAKLQINLRSAGSYTFAVGFLGDDDYTGAMEVYLIKVNKKPTIIKAASETYKASEKTKTYTVTLTTKACSSADSKVYMDSGKVVKLTIGGKTYTAKTNSKGRATFNIGLTTKGTYTATVKFAGDSSYQTSTKNVRIVLK